MDLKECYYAAGADYADVIRRFLTEDRVDRFLKMFLKDRSYQNLCNAVEAGNGEDAFRASHTMKGICMNLSLTALLECCVALTENLRPGEINGETAPLFEQVKKAYLQTISAIEEHLK